MRVLLAMDGSDASDDARNLVGSLSWPEASVIRIVSVVEPMSAVLVGIAPYAATEFDDREIAASLESRLADAAELLARPGRTIETRLLHGRPASAIVEEAADLSADLVVVGSRGLGRLRSMLLGSVSAEVVDHAPCPVLVARASSIGPVLVAVDGSDSARRAVEHLAAARYLAGHRIQVLTVGPSMHSGRPYWALGMTESAARRVDDLAAEDRRRTEGHAARAAEELQRDGYEVHWTLGGGDAGSRDHRGGRALRLRPHRHGQPGADRARAAAPRERRSQRPAALAGLGPDRPGADPRASRGAARANASGEPVLAPTG